jgi:Na+/H+-translocating membrane pyrophosphatase
VRLLAAADEGLREFFAWSFLGTAVSGLIVVGLILGSVVLSVVLLVQVRPLFRCFLSSCLLPALLPVCVCV